MRRGLPLLLVLLLAGCASREAPEPASPVELVPLGRPYDLGRCDILELVVPVDGEAARPHVPAGFALVAAQGRVNAVFGAASCERGARAFLALPVTPEDERLEAPGVRHFFEPEHDVLDDGFAAALADVRAAATRVERIAAVAAAPTPTIEVVGDGWAHRLSGPGVAPAPAQAGLLGTAFREWTAAEGGFAYLEASFAAAGRVGGGPARLETGDGTPARALLGASATGALLVFEGSGYADASLGFVPYP